MSGNRILAALTTRERALLDAVTRMVDLREGQVLARPGVPAESVYFVHGGLVSLFTTLSDGRVVNGVTLADEGVVPVHALAPAAEPAVQAMVLVGGSAAEVQRDVLWDVSARAPGLRQLLEGAARSEFARSMQLVACHTTHDLRQRLARWLLAVGDQLESSQIPITYESLAQHLGTTRSHLNVVAGELVARGYLSHRRGHIRIDEPENLRAVACECYDAIRQSLWPGGA